jgi:deazaflavin-dependent oxidoreductase (nitroreductase family)
MAAIDTGRPVTLRVRRYSEAGPLARIVRRTAASRPMTWVMVRLQQPADMALYRLTNGRATLSSLLSGLPIAVLTTTGARSGTPRTLPVIAMPADNGLIVIASNYGRPNHPAWYHNLMAHPRAHVNMREIDCAVIAHELTGAERDRHFGAAVDLHPGFGQYATRAPERRIPVLQLTFAPTE